MADKAVKLGIVESVSHETVRRTLRKPSSGPTYIVKGWVIPPKKSAAFVWRMEVVLDLYEEPYDEKRPVVCLDECPCQLLAEVREPLAGKPGCPERRDHEYENRFASYDGSETMAVRGP